MVRYSAGHKDRTRQRMIETAARRIKASGVDGSGVAALMSDAGLTNGAFYAHFESKADLVAAVVAHELAAQGESLEALPAGRAAVMDYVRAYLSHEHRDNLGDGCPSAALLDEIGRCGDGVRAAYTQGLPPIIDLLAQRLAGIGNERPRERALGLFTMLVATVQLARAVTDPELSDQVLAAGVSNAEVLIG